MPVMFESRAKGVTPLTSVNGLMFKSRLSTGLQLVPWSTGSDAQIKAMIDAYYAGELTLADIQSVWSIGDERTVNLSAMEATGVGESHVAQTQTFVIMNWGGKFLTSPSGTWCLAIVGQKNCLANGTSLEAGYINTTESFFTITWNNCKRRTWCNEIYRNAIPEGFRAIFKEFRNPYNGSAPHDYFELPSEKEVFGTTTYADTNQSADYGNQQFEYYKTGHKIKYPGDSESGNISYWLRSVNKNNAKQFVGVNYYGQRNVFSYTSAYGLAPFGCI